MRKFNDYDTTEVNDFGERLKLGGHICKVLEAKVETGNSQKDGKPYEMLVIKFDIDEPDAQAGFYNRKFVQDAQKDAINAKWKGYYRLSVPNDNSEDFIKKAFKTFTTSIEKTNPGYIWNWEENTLVGKKFGGIFGYEEFSLPTTGETILLTKIRFVRSTEKIEEAVIPKVKLLDKTYVDYQEYINKKKNGENDNSSDFSNTNATFGDNDDLPF